MRRAKGNGSPVPYPDAGIGEGWEPAALLVLTLALLSVGLLTLYSASSVMASRDGMPDHHYVVLQLTGAALGFFLLFVASRIPLRGWRALAWPSIGIGALLLILTVLPGTEAIAPRINGARRWLNLGITIQPSEFVKLAMIVWTAHMAVRKQDQLHGLVRGLLPIGVVWGCLLTPVLLQPNLSTAAVIGMLGVCILFAAGVRWAHFGLGALLAVPLLILQMQEGFRAARFSAFLDPGAHLDGAGFQVRQSLIAIGSGGIGGVGYGEGRQKFGFLPEPHNDFIFAMIGEEWGFLGSLLVIALYLALIWVGFRIARRAPDLFGELLAIGFTSLIALHALLHIGVGLALIPSTGLPLPLISYGRSNLLVTLIAVGGLVAVARSREEPRLPSLAPRREQNRTLIPPFAPGAAAWRR